MRRLVHGWPPPSSQFGVQFDPIAKSSSPLAMAWWRAGSMLSTRKKNVSSNLVSVTLVSNSCPIVPRKLPTTASLASMISISRGIMAQSEVLVICICAPPLSHHVRGAAWAAFLLNLFRSATFPLLTQILTSPCGAGLVSLVSHWAFFEALSGSAGMLCGIASASFCVLGPGGGFFTLLVGSSASPSRLFGFSIDNRPTTLLGSPPSAVAVAAGVSPMTRDPRITKRRIFVLYTTVSSGTEYR